MGKLFISFCVSKETVITFCNNSNGYAGFFIVSFAKIFGSLIIPVLLSTLYDCLSTEKFKVQIDDYNSIENNSKFISSLNSSIENLKSNNSEVSDKLLNSIKDEFSEIKI